ncbi:MAG: GDP-L-fucose synthase [Proteiniphilum sp.]|nr:GDP-L-fucose synthase [Proteiniphilum sp.]
MWENLQKKGYSNLIGRTHSELDLTDGGAVARFFETERPEYVFLAAAHVGGIMANNTYRADFIYRNLQIQNHVIGESWRSGVRKLLFLGSTCIYPREALQPMSEEVLLTAPLEYTNEPYAIAKIAGLKMCESFNLQYGTNFIAVMPTNLYGPNDNFDLERSHVLPAMIRKIHLAKCLMEGDMAAVREDLRRRPVKGIGATVASAGAKADKRTVEGIGVTVVGENADASQVEGVGDAERAETATDPQIIALLEKYGVTRKGVTLWGSGRPLREFLWSEEMADACVYIMERVDFSDLAAGKTEVRNCHINIGTGKEISIRDLAMLIKKTVDYRGEIRFDSAKPDGTLRKLTDPSKLNALGWKHRIEIDEGVRRLYDWYCS